MLDLLITEGMLVDGTGNSWFRGDVGVKDGKIAGIYRGESPPEARKVINARHLAVCPGFIDIHTHSDYTILHHHRATSSLRAGVTTEAMGMCGHTVFPVTELTRPQIERSMAAFSDLDPGEVPEVDWRDLAGWLDRLVPRGLGINVGQLTGHGMLRTAVMGPEGKGGEAPEPTRDQTESMKAALRESLEQGSLGLATGLGYPPGRNALTSEVAELAEEVARVGGVHISHIRNESDLLASAAAEVIEVSRHSGVKTSISHHKAMGWENWGKTEHTLAMLEKARTREGLEVWADFYPWEYAAQSNLGSIFLPSLDSRGLSREDLISRLKGSSSFKELKEGLRKARATAQEAARKRYDALAPKGIPASMEVFSPSNQYVVHSPRHPQLVGLNFYQVIRQAGRDFTFENMLEVLRQIYIHDEGHTYIAGGKMSQADVDRLMKHPLVAVSTDGWTLSREVDLGRPGLHVHPRQYGTHALVLGSFVRERGVVRLEEAVRKMTALPASILGLSDRGLLSPGFWADVVVFDPRTVANRATHGRPEIPPEGIRCVLVNGQVALEEAKPTGALAGQVVRRARS